MAQAKAATGAISLAIHTRANSPSPWYVFTYIHGIGRRYDYCRLAHASMVPRQRARYDMGVCTMDQAVTGCYSRAVLHSFSLASTYNGFRSLNSRRGNIK